MLWGVLLCWVGLLLDWVALLPPCRGGGSEGKVEEGRKEGRGMKKVLKSG